MALHVALNQICSRLTWLGVRSLSMLDYAMGGDFGGQGGPWEYRLRSIEWSIDIASDNAYQRHT